MEIRKTVEETREWGGGVEDLIVNKIKKSIKQKSKLNPFMVRLALELHSAQINITFRVLLQKNGRPLQPVCPSPKEREETLTENLHSVNLTSNVPLIWAPTFKPWFKELWVMWTQHSTLKCFSVSLKVIPLVFCMMLEGL